MEKTIKFPITSKTSTPIDALRRAFRKWQCRGFNHASLTSKTLSIMEEILETHGVKQRFYDYDNVDVKINTGCGLQFYLSKRFQLAEENIILEIHKKLDFGQQEYSVVFETIQGKIVGIRHMTKGFSFDSTFDEHDSETLNPEVLVELLLNKSKFSNGTLIELNISNRSSKNAEL